MNLSSDSPVLFERETKERRWGAGLFFGLLLLAAVIFIVRNLGEERRFVELLSKARPLWLLAGLAYQLVTYICAAGVWWLVLSEAKVRVRLRSLAPLGLAKLFVDQVFPTAGVGGSLLVVRGLVRRGSTQPVATAAVLMDLLSFYAAHAIAVGLAVVILWAHRDLHPAVLTLATIFSIVAVSVPLTILWLTRRGPQPVGRFSRRIPIVSGVLQSIAQAPAEIMRNRRLFSQATVLQLAIFTLDAATLDAMLRAIGHPATPDTVFAAFSMASVAATVSLIPAGLGAFEASSVLMLRFLAIPIEAGLAATLLLRGFTLWLPMVPGLMVSRRENLKRD